MKSVGFEDAVFTTCVNHLNGALVDAVGGGVVAGVDSRVWKRITRMGHATAAVAKVPIERWRMRYNKTMRPHSLLRYRSSALKAVAPPAGWGPTTYTRRRRQHLNKA